MSHDGWNQPLCLLVGLVWIGVTLLSGADARAQSSGGLSGSASQLQINQAESRALQVYGSEGGSLMPQDRVVTCDGQGAARIGSQKQGTIFDVPKSLVDEEIMSSDTGDTIIIGDTTVLPCQ